MDGGKDNTVLKGEDTLCPVFAALLIGPSNNLLIYNLS
jgi:hypothetical protein